MSITSNINIKTVTETGFFLKYALIPAVVVVEMILFVIQYTPKPAGTLNEKYASNRGRYFSIRCN